MDNVWFVLWLFTDPMAWVMLIGAFIALNILLSAITKARFGSRRRL